MRRRGGKGRGRRLSQKCGRGRLWCLGAGKPIPNHPLPYPAHVPRLQWFTGGVCQPELGVLLGCCHPIGTAMPILVELVEVVPHPFVEFRFPALACPALSSLDLLYRRFGNWLPAHRAAVTPRSCPRQRGALPSDAPHSDRDGAVIVPRQDHQMTASEVPTDQSPAPGPPNDRESPTIVPRQAHQMTAGVPRQSRARTTK